MVDEQATVPSEDSPVQSIRSLHSIDVDLPPSCVEFSPVLCEYFVVGTYSLQDQTTDAKVETGQTQSRKGSVILFRADGDHIELVQSLDHPAAVFDLHFWAQRPDLFGVVSSDGTLSLYQLVQKSTPHIRRRTTFQILPKDTMITALAFHPSFSRICGISLADGSVSMYQISLDCRSIKLLADHLIHHSLSYGPDVHEPAEAWTVAFPPTRIHTAGRGGVKFFKPPYAIYSGGDDGRLRCTAVNSMAEFENDKEDLINRCPGQDYGMTGHTAGVTAILPLPLPTAPLRDILLTGSYDDVVRVYAVYDHRKDAIDRSPKTIASRNLGGGVWRLKLMQARVDGNTFTFRVLASCMHAGVRILDVRGSILGEWEIDVVAKFTDHKSMNYGSDMQPGQKGGFGTLCVSTSFYDKLLCLWRL